MSYEADRALQVASEMERLGHTFYVSLASGSGDKEIAALALKCAKEEEFHITAFKRMRESLPDVHRGPKLSEEELFTASKELRDRIMPKADEVRNVALSRDLRKALDMAIGMEDEAVSYYTALATGKMGLNAAVLNLIVDEEKRHGNILRGHRQRLFPQG
jgi:rubrerythrin